MLIYLVSLLAFLTPHSVTEISHRVQNRLKSDNYAFECAFYVREFSTQKEYQTAQADLQKKPSDLSSYKCYHQTSVHMSGDKIHTQVCEYLGRPLDLTYIYDGESICEKSGDIKLVYLDPDKGRSLRISSLLPIEDFRSCGFGVLLRSWLDTVRKTWFQEQMKKGIYLYSIQIDEWICDVIRCGVHDFYINQSGDILMWVTFQDFSVIRVRRYTGHSLETVSADYFKLTGEEK